MVLVLADDFHQAIAGHIEAEGWGKRTLTYRMRNWLISAIVGETDASFSTSVMSKDVLFLRMSSLGKR